MTETITAADPRPADRAKFRNTVNWRLGETTRWTLLTMTRAEQYRAWGARIVAYFPAEDRRAGGAAMLYLDDDRWYYAHAGDGSAWCDMSEGYAAASGEEAIAAEGLHRAERDVRHARANLVAAEEALVGARAALREAREAQPPMV